MTYSCYTNINAVSNRYFNTDWQFRGRKDNGHETW